VCRHWSAGRGRKGLDPSQTVCREIYSLTPTLRLAPHPTPDPDLKPLIPARRKRCCALPQLLDSGMAVAGLRGGQGQTPMISSNYAFDMNTPLQI